MKLVVAWVEDEDRRQPKGRRAPRLAAATGMAEAEAQMRLTAFYVSRGRKRDEEGLDDEEPRGPDGCARCGLRGEHVCLEAVATVGSSAVALLGAV